MNLRELFTTNKLFADFFNQTNAEEFAVLFDISVPIADILFLERFGERQVRTFFIDNTEIELRQKINAFIELNKKIWYDKKERLISENGLPVMSKNTRTGTIGTNGNDTTEKINRDKAFNDLTFFENERNTNDTTKTETQTFDVTDTRSGFSNFRDFNTYLSQTQTDRQTAIMRDIANYLTKKIY